MSLRGRLAAVAISHRLAESHSVRDRRVALLLATTLAHGVLRLAQHAVRQRQLAVHPRGD